MKTCPSCGAEAPDEVLTCARCGKPIESPAASAEPPKGEKHDGPSACPQCQAAWQAGAVICLACGYDVRTGRKLATVHGVEEPPPVVRPTTGLKPVRLGLFLHLVVVSAWLLSIPLGVILLVQSAELETLLEAAAQGEPLERSPFIAAIVMVLALVVLVLLQWILGIVGSVLCLWLPRQSGARGWLIASLVLAVAMAPVGFTVYRLNWPAHLLNLLWLPSWAAWILSVRNLAFYLGRREDAQEAASILVHMLIVLFLIPMVGFPLLCLAVLGLISAFECLGAVVGMVCGVSAFVGWLIYYVKVLFSLFELIARLRQELLPKPSGAAPGPAVGV